MRCLNIQNIWSKHCFTCSLSTALYFIVFGSAIGSRIGEIDGVSYSSFIVPGLIMLTVLTQSLSNASFGIFFPKFSGTIYEVLSAPISPFEITTGYVTSSNYKISNCWNYNFNYFYIFCRFKY